TLPASRRPHDRDELPRRHIKADVADNLNFMRPVPDGLDQIPNNNHDSILDENDRSSFIDGIHGCDSNSAAARRAPGHPRIRRQSDGGIRRASWLRLSRTTPAEIRREGLQVSRREYGYQRRHDERRTIAH